VDAFVARQAILDRDRRVHGYELLFRSNAVRNEFDGRDSTSATLELLANSLLALGLDNLRGGQKAFINFDRELLLTDWHYALPKENAVIELLETVTPDAEVLEACRRLRGQGYRIALDDFLFRKGNDALLGVADLVKVEIQSVPKPEQEALVRSCHARGLEMLAERVETHEEFEWARRAGYDYFQGYFFARPAILHARQIPVVKMRCLRLMHETVRPELDFNRLDTLISEDVGFAYKLLRYVNSAMHSRSATIRSIRHALAYLGEAELRRWIALAAFPGAASDKPGELVTCSLVRARFCESLARESGKTASDPAFLMGLFSLLDAMIDRPLEEALAQVNLALEIAAVLTGSAAEDDPLAVIYSLAKAYEAAHWGEVEPLARQLGSSASCLSEAYCEAVQWAQQVQTAGS
jgi:c-di-GMP-related signal transduction protein